MYSGEPRISSTSYSNSPMFPPLLLYETKIVSSLCAGLHSREQSNMQNMPQNNITTGKEVQEGHDLKNSWTNVPGWPVMRLKRISRPAPSTLVGFMPCDPAEKEQKHTGIELNVRADQTKQLSSSPSLVEARLIKPRSKSTPQDHSVEIGCIQCCFAVCGNSLHRPFQCCILMLTSHSAQSETNVLTPMLG
jgi:hypothetical protein